jgi:hypothetical protein
MADDDGGEPPLCSDDTVVNNNNNNNQQIMSSNSSSNAPPAVVPSSYSPEDQPPLPVDEEDVLEKIKEAAGTVLHTLTTKREPGVLPKPVQDKLVELEKAGQDAVTTLSLIRKPMDEYVKELLQGISGGAYKAAVQDSPYDEMFHLSLLVNGKYRLEKNEVIVLTDAPPKLPSGAQFMRVVIPSVANTSTTMTIRSMLEKTKAFMGDQDFTNYHARSNNCQNFVMGLLKGNDLATDLLHDFTYQNAETIFAQMPEYTTAMAVAMTDAAAVADKLLKDRPIECQVLVAELAQASRSAYQTAQQSEAYQKLMAKAKILHDKYGDRIPEDRLRETLQEMRLVIALPDVSMLQMSISDKMSQLFGKLGGGHNKKESAANHGGSKGSSLGLSIGEDK